jgi:hypothetical protein
MDLTKPLIRAIDFIWGNDENRPGPSWNPLNTFRRRPDRTAEEPQLADDEGPTANDSDRPDDSNLVHDSDLGYWDDEDDEEIQTLDLSSPSESENDDNPIGFVSMNIEDKRYYKKCRKRCHRLLASEEGELNEEQLNELFGYIQHSILSKHDTASVPTLRRLLVPDHITRIHKHNASIHKLERVMRLQLDLSLTDAQLHSSNGDSSPASLSANIMSCCDGCKAVVDKITTESKGCIQVITMQVEKVYFTGKEELEITFPNIERSYPVITLGSIHTEESNKDSSVIDMTTLQQHYIKTNQKMVEDSIYWNSDDYMDMKYLWAQYMYNVDIDEWERKNVERVRGNKILMKKNIISTVLLECTPYWLDLAESQAIKKERFKEVLTCSTDTHYKMDKGTYDVAIRTFRRHTEKVDLLSYQINVARFDGKDFNTTGIGELKCNITLAITARLLLDSDSHKDNNNNNITFINPDSTPTL